MPIFSVPDRVNKSGLCSFKEKSDVNTVVPVLAVSYSDIDPVIVASVAQHDVNLSLIDFCTPHKLFKTDDPELQKIIDLYKVSRN
jgi:hypothetical protein